MIKLFGGPLDGHEIDIEPQDPTLIVPLAPDEAIDAGQEAEIIYVEKPEDSESIPISMQQYKKQPDGSWKFVSYVFRHYVYKPWEEDDYPHIWKPQKEETP